MDGSIAKVFSAATSEMPMNRGGSMMGSRDPLSNHLVARLIRRVIANAAAVPTTPATTAVALAAVKLVFMPVRNCCSLKITRNHLSEIPWGGQLRFDPEFSP